MTRPGAVLRLKRLKSTHLLARNPSVKILMASNPHGSLACLTKSSRP